MIEKIDFQTVNIIYDALAPLIKTHGQSKLAISQFAFYLLIISAAIADQLGIPVDQFQALAVNAFAAGKLPTKSNSAN